MNKAVFLDRDGVINEVSLDKEFYYKKEDIKIISGVETAIKNLKEKGYVIVVITNQPVIARGLASLQEIEQINDSINKLLGGLIDKFYICPHHPEMHADVPEYAKHYRIACECRKPLPGMVNTAVKELKISIEKSWFVGDMIVDVLCGKNAGCKTVQIKSPHSYKRTKSAKDYDSNAKADFNAENLKDAVEVIIKNSDA